MTTDPCRGALLAGTDSASTLSAVYVSEFDYELPRSAIAQEPMEPRDAARLLCLPGTEDRVFSDLPDLLDADDLLVVNRTRVRAARLQGTKRATGGKIEVLLLDRLDARVWTALVRPARRLRPGAELDLNGISGVVISGPDEGICRVDLQAPEGDVEELLPSVGQVPLPPYFEGELADPERYQTIFAKQVGSAAAPTAALHFTPALRERLLASGVGFAEVELQVGLDTFRPMAVATLDEHVIHAEHIIVPDEAAHRIARTRERGGRVIAVGTTVVRTLESAARGKGKVEPFVGTTDLFITPGYRAQAIDAFITNFHAPRTTLIALVAALAGPSWRKAYEHALESGYRFLSFGDAMFIL